MNKLRFASLALGMLLVSSLAFAYPDEPTFESVTKLGPNQRQGVAVREIKLVRYTSRDANAITINSGDAVVYDTNSDDGVSIRRTTTSADGALAGILVTQILTADGNSTSALDDAGRRNWGWALVHGPVVANVTAGGTNVHSIGDPFYTSKNEGSVTTLETFTYSMDSGVTLATYNSNALHYSKKISASGGFFMDAASASDTTAEVFVTLE